MKGDYVSLVYLHDDTYDMLEDVLVFDREQSARDFLRRMKKRAEDNGALEDYRNDRALAYLTWINEDNHMLTYRLDPIAKKIYG